MRNYFRFKIIELQYLKKTIQGVSLFFILQNIPLPCGCVQPLLKVLLILKVSESGVMPLKILKLIIRLKK